MAISVGDNFRYLGKKFLDDRQSFRTLDELFACSAVPEGFIAYCEENRTRYEFVNGEWQEYIVLTGNGTPGGGNQGDVILNEEQVIGAVLYIGDDEPFAKRYFIVERRMDHQNIALGEGDTKNLVPYKMYRPI